MGVSLSLPNHARVSIIGYSWIDMSGRGLRLLKYMQTGLERKSWRGGLREY